jgi:hypothetical protein
MVPREPSTPDIAHAMNRSSTSTLGRASASKFFMQTAPWRRSAGAALVGFGALAVAALRQTVRFMAHLLRATQRIGTQ